MSTKKVVVVLFVLSQVRTFPNASDQIIGGEPQIHVRAELDVKALIRSPEVSQMMLESCYMKLKNSSKDLFRISMDLIISTRH